jgi:formylglycine-generating enzyme required for sulfatase activity
LPLALFLFGCSDENQAVTKPSSSFVPFPPKVAPDLTKEEKKMLKRSDFVKIEPGEFLMGSPDDEPGRQSNETLHKVKITNPYYLGVSEVTIAEWNRLQPKALQKDDPFFLTNSTKGVINRLKKEFPEEMKDELELNSDERVFTVEILEKIVPVLERKYEAAKKAENIKQDPAWSSGDIELGLKELRNLVVGRKSLPVTDVSYPQAKSFCWRRTEYAWRNSKIPKGMVFRLPTEAEWEYACRAGLKGVCGLEEGEKLSGMNANINGGKKEFIIGEESYLIHQKKLIPVGVAQTKYPANAWGIRDMHGSVYEWCHDYYAAYPTEELTIDPLGPIRGKDRVLRGGSFIRTAHESRSAARHSVEPSWRGSEIGFRVVLGFPL